MNNINLILVSVLLLLIHTTPVNDVKNFQSDLERLDKQTKSGKQVQFKQFDRLISKALMSDSVVVAFRTAQLAARYAFESADYKNQLHYLNYQDSILNATNLKRLETTLRAEQLSDLARYYWYTNKSQEIDCRLKIIDLLEDQDSLTDYEKSKLCQSYNFAGNYLILNQRNYDGAFSYYLKSRKLCPGNLQVSKKIGEFYLSLKDTLNGFSTFRNALVVAITWPEDEERNKHIIDLSVGFVGHLIDWGKINEAEQVFKNLDIYPISNTYNGIEYFRLRALLLKSHGKYLEARLDALNYLNKMQAQYGIKKYETINAYFLLAEIEHNLGENKMALKTVQTGLQASMKESSRYLDNIDLTSDTLLFKFNAIELLDLQAKIYAALGQNAQALSSGQNALRLIHDVQSSLTEIDDMNKVNQEFSSIYETVLTLLAGQDGKPVEDSLLVQSALNIFEQSKNLTLLNNFKHSKAISFAHIPKELVIEELNLKKAIRSMTDSLQINMSTLDQKTMSDMTSELQNAKIKYEKLVNQFKTNYPKYFQLKYSAVYPEINEIRRNLKRKDEAYIQYFIGKQFIYAVTITGQQTSFQKICRFDEAYLSLKEVTDGMKMYQKNFNTYKTMRYDSSYISHAHKLYKLVLKPLETILESDSVNNLVLVHDGELGLLPFEILLTEPVSSEQSGRYKKYPFLVHKYNISYNTSAKVWLEMCQSVQRDGLPVNWYGFAPEYSNLSSATGLVDLEYADKEIESVHKLLGGTVYKGKKAVKARFRKVSAEHSVLQFAGHCVMNNAQPDKSYLAFSSTNSQDASWKLTTNEIYGMYVNTEYLILSACETGIGQINKGEGIMSLSRAFSYAGATAILSTLWQVDDKSASDIMYKIYTHLAAGKMKDEALRMAKLDFIRSGTNSHAHPFHWGPFITYGDTSDINLLVRGSLFSGKIIYLGVLCLIGLAGIFWWRRK